MAVAKAVALGVRGATAWCAHNFPFGRRLRRHAVRCGKHDEAILLRRVFALHGIEEGATHHLGRAEQRLKPAVEERERAVAHLELGICLELVGLDRSILRPARTTAQLHHALMHRVDESHEHILSQKLLLEIVPGEPLDKVELFRARRRQLECGDEDLLQHQALQPL